MAPCPERSAWTLGFAASMGTSAQLQTAPLLCPAPLLPSEQSQISFLPPPSTSPALPRASSCSELRLLLQHEPFPKHNTRRKGSQGAWIQGKGQTDRQGSLGAKDQGAAEVRTETSTDSSREPDLLSSIGHFPFGNQAQDGERLLQRCQV